MHDSFDFNDRTVLVTGGARGIGLELSRQLAAKGAHVIAVGRDALRSFTRSLRDQCRAAKLPIQLTEAVMTLVDTTLSRAGPLRKYPPALAAADLIAGIERGLDEIWIEKTKLLRIVHRISPELAYCIMRDR
ncbi:SDR family NAD(P)-dependent oxidoreductase [Aminobacter ciceronei]|uniref:NAD(P)-dependent dehydrogenase (Short-subunit alcohol dehydrogenase family) n=1 Tax=Aminobacter ciceronei TaxID=150723 RepID=A0ABR6BZV7_9HYPH|nr:SDR family oxidoreductase [Aminobacter ciceronei]MBA8904428.1 NAD(P)-dependent dehydrogenase (short-subunit alcohol dehydrogenase family) [Aminobacter ciceronei]MBA9018206.1 NAD(P)-dependent dehydrogenase (short-subunit alcohol dehydrogenase family) [Aminobacter ciceronei]